MTFLYSFLFILGLLLSSPYWIWRAWKKHELGLTQARLGGGPWDIPKDPKSRLWMHAVSVGEVQAAQPLIAAIRRTSPEQKIVLSVTTRTGMEMARQSLPADGGVIGPLAFPLDLPWAVKRRIREVQPAAVIIVDTELWPNFITESFQRGVKLFLVNGRISDKSFGRYYAVRKWLKPFLEKFTLFWMQSELNADRILSLGAPADKIRIGGNLKIDAMTIHLKNHEGRQVDVPTPKSETAPLFLAVSTHPGEEQPILEAAMTWIGKGRAFRLGIAPRHPERAKEVRRLMESCGFNPIVRSISKNGGGAAGEIESWANRAGGRDVLLIDTIGELLNFYPLARVVFVGGSLVPAGGHNIFEPAAFGRPILFGPHMENFREAEQALSGHGALRIPSSQKLAESTEALLFDAPKALRLGKSAKETLRSLQGAAGRIASDMLEIL